MPNVEMISTLNTLTESIKLINANLERLTDSTLKLYDRIDVLEKDLQERSIKRKLVKSMFAFYPFILIFLFTCLGIDHNEIATLTKDIRSIMQDTQTLQEYSLNDDEDDTA